MFLTTTYHNYERYDLRVQPVRGEVCIDDALKGAVVEAKFKPFDVPRAVPPEGSINVGVMYTSEAEEKVSPLFEVMKKYFDKVYAESQIIFHVENFKFNIKNTGVPAQPYDPDGMQGALNRIIHVQNLLQKDTEWDQTFPRPITVFDYIFIPSVESDIFMDPKTRIAYDKPNIIIYECMTGRFVAGKGRGPQCQESLFTLYRIMQAKGSKITYGEMLANLFSGKDAPEGNDKIEFAASDWHGTVSGVDKDNMLFDRAYFIREVCEHLDEELWKLFAHVFGIEID